MLSKARIKLIQSLNLKKHRSELKLFVVEGKKQVTELLTSNYHINCIVATPNWANAFAQDIKNNTELIIVTAEELKKISLLQTPQEVLALVEVLELEYTPEILKEQFTIVLDGIQDPGNMGTIIRIADWYGIKNIVCSNTCEHIYLASLIGAFVDFETVFAKTAGIAQLPKSMRIRKLPKPNVAKARFACPDENGCAVQ